MLDKKIIHKEEHYFIERGFSYVLFNSYIVPTYVTKSNSTLENAEQSVST